MTMTNTDSSKGGGQGDLEDSELHSKSKGFKSVSAMRSKPVSVKAIFEIGGFTKTFDVEFPPPPEMQIISPLSLRIRPYPFEPDFGTPTDITGMKRWKFIRKEFNGEVAIYKFVESI